MIIKVLFTWGFQHRSFDERPPNKTRRVLNQIEDLLCQGHPLKGEANATPRTPFIALTYPPELECPLVVLRPLTAFLEVYVPGVTEEVEKS
jgi:hypothetical protein